MASPSQKPGARVGATTARNAMTGRRVETDAVTRADVIAAYRLFLGRQPESSVAVEYHMKAASIRELTMRFASASEFQCLLLEVGSKDVWVACEPFEGARLWVNLADRGVSTSIMRDGTWEPGETAYMLRRLKPGAVMVDAGANVGWFSLIAARAVGPQGRIHAFEPNPEVVGCLSRSISESGLSDRVTLHACALSDAPGRAAVGRDVADRNLGHAWMLTPEEVQASELQASEVEVVRLDDLVKERIDFIKIDIEGREPPALAGAERVLTQDRPVVMSEMYPEQMMRVSGVSQQAFIARMDGWGYDCRMLEGEEATTLLTPDHPTIERIYTVVFEPREIPTPAPRRQRRPRATRQAPVSTPTDRR